MFFLCCIVVLARNNTTQKHIAVTTTFASYAEGVPGKDKRSESIPVAPQKRELNRVLFFFVFALVVTFVDMIQKISPECWATVRTPILG